MTISQLNANIADFLDWHAKGQLILNPDFQRRQVWSQSAKVFLIDTILRELSVPKFYIRTKIDLTTKKSLREVVDGQQRLSAIIDFSNDKIKLSKRAGEFSGYTYSTLPEDIKEKFLKYVLSVEVLVNATDTDVLEVFSRLNSYGERLNSAELRHAEFQGMFKWLVRDTSKELSGLWEKYNIIGVQQRLRMQDDTLVAEMYGFLLDGLGEGGEPVLNKLYRTYDEKIDSVEHVRAMFGETLKTMTERYDDALKGPLSRRPNFLMLFAAVAHSLYGLSENKIIDMPARKQLADNAVALNALARLSEALEVDDEPNLPKDLRDFKQASSTTTQRMKSREIRFKAFYNAITE